MRARALNPPPPLGGRSVPNRNRELTDSKASAASAHSAGPVPKYQLFYFGASIFRFFQIFGPFFLSQKTSKFRLRPKRLKISKIWSRSVFGSDFGCFLDPCWHQFSQYFTIPRKPLFCNTSPAKRSFSPPKPSHFGTNFRSNFDVFRVSFSDTLFSSFFQHDTQKHDFWTPLGIQLGPKWHPKSAKWCQKARKKHRCASLLGEPESTLLFLKP